MGVLQAATIAVAAALVQLGVAAPSYADQATEIADMMRAARAPSQGPEAQGARRGPAAAPKGTASSELFPSLDSELLEKANRIQHDLRLMAEPASSGHPKAALAVKAASKDKEQSRHDRAARFFATHGMEEVGRMLGDEMSAEGRRQALRQAAESQRLATPAGPALRHSAPPASGSAHDGGLSVHVLDADLAMDDDDASYKASWKAVEALQRRRPAGLH
ncbi:unnamed protein product [Prorocentrum cordatum]|uniref:Uncharacterized protein n=1 Tax=Prorocentrum cordatum TaxID=2364126 RepID=A0ABN9YBL4_9DINO|nr:unnamed protein product [Polarella glacialis]